MTEKKYIIDNAELMAEWNWEKNADILPSQLTLCSHKKAWWKCSKGHEWQATIADRNKGYGCPYCSGRYTVKGENDLQTINPTLAKEWNLDKNSGLTPADVKPNSHNKVWWKCSKGHEWQATISNRTMGRGCPYCSGKKVLNGYNDLQANNPTLAKEWNYEKNNGLAPVNVTSNSNKKVWWRCNKGHEWQAIISSRNKGHGCPYCSGLYVIKGENDLQTVNPSLAKEWNYEKNNESTPSEFLANSEKMVWWMCNKGHEWQASIANRNNGRGCPICNSERNTSFPEYVIVYYLKKYGLDVVHSFRDKGYELDIYIPSKNIAIEYDGSFWHKNKAKKDLEKNFKCRKDGIKLYRIREELPQLNDSSIDYIIQENQRDLPNVLEKILSEIIGISVDIDLTRDAIAIENLREYSEKERSILCSNPKIAKEWNYDKNGNLRPEYFAANSNKKVWWLCSEGHEWQATIDGRNNGYGCPYCSGRYAARGENDLQTFNPSLAKEWNYEKNDELTPTDVTSNSGQKVWWKCDKGHEWQAKVYHRNNGSGCPYCSGRNAIKGENDLQTVNPNLAKEWNYEKNNGLTPVEVMPNSGKKAWWKCKEGHEWQATIGSRNKGSSCPICRKKQRTNV